MDWIMGEKRFELQINGNGQVDIIDWVESKEKNAICIYNDLGVLPFSSAKALCELLNQLYDENQSLIKDNYHLEARRMDLEKRLQGKYHE